MFGKMMNGWKNGWKKVTVIGAALSALAAVAAIPAHALPNLAGRDVSVNLNIQHDKTQGIDYTNTLKIATQDALGNFAGKYVDKYGTVWSMTGKVSPLSWDNYSFNWSATAIGKAMQFSGVLNAPVPATQYHKVTLFATGTYLCQSYQNGQWYSFGPAPMSLTADEYYVYTYPSPIITVDPSVLTVSP